MYRKLFLCAFGLAVFFSFSLSVQMAQAQGETRVDTAGTPKVEPEVVRGSSDRLKLNYSNLDPNTTYTVKRAIIIGGTPGGWEVVGITGKLGALPLLDISLEEKKQYAYALFNETGEIKVQSSWYSQIPDRRNTTGQAVVMLGSEEKGAIGSSENPITPPANPPQGLVPCDNTVGTDGKIAYPCDFNAFMALINKVIRFILFSLAIPIAAIMFAYAGFLLVTSGGSTEARGKAKNIATNTVYGLVIAAGAWLIIRTILSILGYDGAWIGFPFIV